VWVYVRIQGYFISPSRSLKRLVSVSRSPIYAHFQETLGGVDTIRAYGQSDRFFLTNVHHLDTFATANYASLTSLRWLNVRTDLLSWLITLGTAVFAVHSAMHSEGMDAGWAGLAVTFALDIAISLNWTIRTLADVETNMVSMERIKEVGGLVVVGVSETDRRVGGVLVV
jgi:ATP-binding cassette, subfamily C (CFTR/MRP), member 1